MGRWCRRLGESNGDEGIGVRLGKRLLIEGFVDPLPDGLRGTLEDFGDPSGLKIFFEDEMEGTSPEALGIGFGHDDVGLGDVDSEGERLTRHHTTHPRFTQEMRYVEPLLILHFS